MIKLKRNYFEKQTEGLIEIYEYNHWLYHCYSLELPWLNNNKNRSCIPEGKYNYTKEIQAKRGKVLRLHNVLNREGVLMHFGNYAGSKNPYTKMPDTKGCILPGESLIDIDGDGLKDITSSKKTMNTIYDLLPDEGFVFIMS